MRELKFRVWDNEKNRYHNLPNSMVIDLNGKIVLMTDKGPYPFPIDSNRFIVQQYTGCKDKNGKEIYEGDIVQSDSGNIFEVSFDDASFVLLHDEGYHTLAAALSMAWSLEVISNIFEYKK